MSPLTIKKMILLRRVEGLVWLPQENSADFRTKLNRSVILENPPSDKLFKTILGTPSNTASIEKYLKHLDQFGEMILCTSKDVLTCPNLSMKLNALGTITDIIDDKDDIIWRFVKDEISKRTLVNGLWKRCDLMNGRLVFLDRNYSVPFKKLFSVKVGAISGYDEAFLSPEGNAEFISAQTLQTGATKRMFFNMYSDKLLPHKEHLLNRKVKAFNEDNWWTWGRNHPAEGARVYVPAKTKRKAPFFCHPCQNYDGTLLGIFPKVKMPLSKVVDLLNGVDWDGLGFRSGSRYIFTQGALEGIMLPEEASNICTSLEAKSCLK